MSIERYVSRTRITSPAFAFHHRWRFLAKPPGTIVDVLLTGKKEGRR